MNEIIDKDRDQDGKYEGIAQIGLVLLTNHGSGSSCERDFSLMNWMVADKTKNRTSHERLEARLGLKSHNNNLKHDCRKCQAIKEKKAVDKELESETSESSDDEDDNIEGEDEEKVVKKKKKHISRHCHCSQFKVSNELLLFMGDGQPNKRYKANEKMKRDASKAEQVLLKNRRKDDEKFIEKHMKIEVQRLKKCLRENVKEKEKERKEKNKEATVAESYDQRKQREKDERRQALSTGC